MSASSPPPGPPPAGPPPPGPPPKGPPPGPPPKGPPKGPPPGPPPGVPALNLKGKKPIVVKDASGTVVRSSEEKWDADAKLTAADKVEHNEEEKKKKARAARFKVCTKGKFFEFLIYWGLATYFVVTFIMVFRHISFSYSYIEFDVFDNSDCDGEPTHTNLIFGSPGDCQRYDGPMLLTATQGYNGDNDQEEYYTFRCLNGDQTADFMTFTCRDTCFWHEKSWEAYGIDNDEGKWHCPIDWNQQPLNDAAVDYEDPKISKCYKMRLFLQKNWEEDFSAYKVLTNKSQVTRYYEYFEYMDPHGEERDEPLNVPACSFQEKDVLDFVDTSGEGADDEEEDDDEEDDARRRRRIMHYVAESTHRARTEGITVAEAKQVQKLRRIVSHPDPLTRRRRLTTDPYDTYMPGDTGMGTADMDMGDSCPECMTTTYDAADICSTDALKWDEPLCSANPDCQWCFDKGECGVTCEFDACNYWALEAECNMDMLCSWENESCSSSFTSDDFEGCDMNLDLFKTVAQAIMSRNGDWHWESRVWWDWENVPMNYKKETCAREAPFSSECVWLEADEECVSIESAMDAIPWDDYAVDSILCSFSPDCLSWQNGPMKQCEQDYGWEICNGCSSGQCSGFEELLRQNAGDTMEGTDLSCSERELESWEQDDEEMQKEQTCIPMQGDDDITFDSICIDGVMYSDHFCNTSVMGMMVLIGMMASGFVGTCALRLFALPLFLRCFKLCCKCCFHDEDHVKGAFTHIAQARKKTGGLARKNTLGSK